MGGGAFANDRGSIVIWGLILAAGFQWLNRLAASRGYYGPWYGVLGVVAYFAAALAIGVPLTGAMSRAAGLEAESECDGSVPCSQARQFIDPMMIFPAVIGLVGFVAVALVVSRRPPRAVLALPGTRRSVASFKELGVFLIIAGVVAIVTPLLGILSRATWTLRAVQVMPALATFGYMFIDAGRHALHLDKRNKAPTADELLAKDHRRPVVFLRTFGLDDFRVRMGRQILTLEELIGPSIHRQVGPFIAVGNPRDYLPKLGAAKSYQSDLGWQPYVMGMLQRASCVLVAEGATSGLQWELETIRQVVPPERVFFVTLPLALRGGQTPWPQFVVALRNAGFHPADVEPPPGALLACDSSWRLTPVQSSSPDLGGALATQVAGAETLAGATDSAILPYVQRQGAPIAFSNSALRYIGMCFGTMVVVALLGFLLLESSGKDKSDSREREDRAHMVEMERLREQQRAADLEERRMQTERAAAEYEERRKAEAAASKRPDQPEESKADRAVREKRAKALQASLQTEIDRGRVELDNRPGRLLIRIPAEVLFQFGSDELTQEGELVIITVAYALKKVTHGKIAVGGHTDNVPIRGKTNTEWSTQRAARVVEKLVRGGLSRSNLSATGYGEQVPLTLNADPAGRAKNRRIEIVLEP